MARFVLIIEGPMDYHAFRVRFLRTIFVVGFAILAVGAYFNFYINAGVSPVFSVLGYVELASCAALVAAFFLVERHTKAVLCVLSALTFLLFTVIAYIEVAFGRWHLSLWYPIFVLTIFIYLGPLWGTLSAVYALLLTVFFMRLFPVAPLMPKVFPPQLALGLVLTVLFFRAFHDMYEKYASFLREVAEVDVLTGAYNRRKFFKVLELEISRYNRNGEPFCLLMIDLDDFKRVNDTKGHLYGDQVLKRVASAIKNSIRRVDSCARYGGDEFVVVASGVDVEGAKTLAERIRKVVKDLDLGITVSIGVAPYREGMDSKSVVAMADEALYRAKRLKDAVVVVEPK